MGLYYFDLVAAAVTLLVTARIIVLAPSWDATTALVAGMFVVSAAGLLVFRRHAYDARTPWLAWLFATTAVAAVVTFCWSLHTLWFAAALALTGSMLTFALVMRTRRISERVALHDIFKLAAITVGLLLGLVCMELALRIAPGMVGPELEQMVRADPSTYGIAHSYIGYLHQPNSTSILKGRDFNAVHQVDGKGFRNAWPWPQAPAIVVVGDSLAFGYGASAAEAWPAIVAKGLPADPLINLALIGAGPQQYERVYETFGATLRPKLLLVGVFARNDFWDAEMFDRWLQSGAGGNYIVWRDFGATGPVTLSVSDPLGSLRSVFDRYAYPRLRSSRVYNLLRAVRSGFGNASPIAPTVFRFRDGSQVVLLPEDFVEKSKPSTKESRAFQLTMDAYERIRTRAAAQGTRVLMVLQPSKEETYLHLLQPDVPDPAAALRNAFDARGIEYLDLTPGFRERAAAGDRLFFEMDGHPNPAGYALTARLVLDHLKKHADKYGLASR